MVSRAEVGWGGCSRLTNGADSGRGGRMPSYPASYWCGTKGLARRNPQAARIRMSASCGKHPGTRVSSRRSQESLPFLASKKWEAVRLRDPSYWDYCWRCPRSFRLQRGFLLCVASPRRLAPHITQAPPVVLWPKTVATPSALGRRPLPSRRAACRAPHRQGAIRCDSSCR